MITATKNGSYTVKLFTEAGYEYEKEFVISNIDKVAANVDIGFKYSVASGISLDYSTLSTSGGTLYVSHNGGAQEKVTDPENFSLAKAGKYEFTFTNGVGQSTNAVTYHVTYGLDGAKLATVSMDENGQVSVSGNASTKLYRAGEEHDIASLKALKAGKYYLEIDNGTEKEIVVFNADGIDTTATSSDGSAIMIAGIVVGCAALVAAAVVCPVVILKGRKRS